MTYLISLSLSVSPPLFRYVGPKYEDLDEKVQDELRVYLDQRNINDGLAEFVGEFAALKEQKDYLSFLKRLKEFA